MARSVPWSLVALLGVALVWQLARAPGESAGAAPPGASVEAFGAALTRMDVDALVALYQPDAEHRDMANGRRVRGREAVKAFLEEYAGASGARALGAEVVSLRQLTPVVAIANVTLHYAGGDPESPAWPPYTAAVLTWRNGAWGIAASRAGGNYATPETGQLRTRRAP